MINSNSSGYLKKLHRICFSTYNQIVKHPRQKEHVAVVLPHLVDHSYGSANG
jgi:hypothetical protein